MDQQQHLIVLMGGTRAPVEAASDHGLAIDHSELVVQLVAAGKAGGADALLL